MTAKLLTRQLWPIWQTCFVAGCGVLPGVPPGPASDATDGGGGVEFSFWDDADPASAALPFVESELLVQPYPGADASALSDLYARTGAAVTGELSEIDLTVLEISEGQLLTVAAKLASSELIESVHKNYVFEAQEAPDDPMFARQPHLAQIRATGAWDITVGSKEIVIAIIDTGVQPDHPDLGEKIIGAWDAYAGNAASGDPIGHGTQTAGVVAAVSNNGAGVTGVTWECPILAIRVTNDAGQTTSRHIAAGILWAVANRAKVINVSFAPLWSNSVVRSAAQQAYHRGSLVVISAGNGGGITNSRGYREALFVGAVNGSNRIASFSDRGWFVDLVAPGTAIRTTAQGSAYRLVDGTSFAAPIVTGIAALAWSVNPDLRPVTIVDALIDHSVDLGEAGKDNVYGHGVVDAAAAIEAVSEASFVLDGTPPTLRITRPSNGSTLSGRFVASATATDRWGVADVVMQVDELPLATDTRAPFRFVVDTEDFDTGRHELSFIATDLAGNVSDAQTVFVVFADARAGSGRAAGTVEFLSPAPGTRVSGDVLISATVAADVGLATIEWRVDGISTHVSALSGAASGVSYLWRASSARSGWHTVTIVLTNSRGGQATGSLELKLVSP